MTDWQKKNLILDVDGTLWDTTRVVAEAWNKAIIADGSSQVRATPERLRELFGKPMNVIGELLFTDVDQQTRSKLLEDCCQYEQQTLQDGKYDLLYPGVAETIRQLVQIQGRKLFIVSNCQSGYIELFLKKNQLGQYVTDMECYGNTGLGKGENIKILMERNGISGADTAYVGDTAGDQEASAMAGVDFIYVRYGFGEVWEPFAAIDSFSELLQIN